MKNLTISKIHKSCNLPQIMINCTLIWSFCFIPFLFRFGLSITFENRVEIAILFYYISVHIKFSSNINFPGQVRSIWCALTTEMDWYENYNDLPVKPLDGTISWKLVLNSWNIRNHSNFKVMINICGYTLANFNKLNIRFQKEENNSKPGEYSLNLFELQINIRRKP